MKIFYNRSLDVAFNQATEEYMLKNNNIKDDILFFWQNKNAIIIGKNQNTLEQINQQEVDKLNIDVMRRISGGGAVYHDLGNVNFTFITDNTRTNINNYRKFTDPIIHALKDEFNIESKFSGKNDIVIDDKKISGNAQYATNDRFMSHGTLLFDINTSVLPKVLYVDKAKLVSKGIQSIRSRVTNIKPLISRDIDSKEFISILLNYFLSVQENELYELTDHDKKEIEKLANEKYRTWDWIYGKSPEATVDNKLRFENAGLIETKIMIEKGIIKSIKFFGDFMSSKDLDGIEQKLIDKKYIPTDVRRVLESFDLPSYFGNLTVDNIIQVMFME